MESFDFSETIASIAPFERSFETVDDADLIKKTVVSNNDNVNKLDENNNENQQGFPTLTKSSVRHLMSQPMNINTATAEELKSIKNIGSKRAVIITAAREEKGQLTIEDLKLLEGIPNTIWDPLVNEGAIIVEPPERTTKDIDPLQRVRELKSK
ncbi:comEA [Mytilus coruscus]|uniref:ComEA n=1 Tax=Mytilus coruscus TaxID=42192 RepID=A0A6J8B313_MYTCO|nr:comEA [Mytilus coruscus]